MATPKAQLHNNRDFGQMVRNPRITEKSTMVAERNVYTFDIDPRATKVDIRLAIKKLYNVTPVKVNVVAIAQKSVMRRGRAGVKGGGRKAFVYLKKGEKIEFV
jgi:large subunit ribosomal protein L23